MKTLKVSIKGRAPLLMEAPTLIDQFHPLTVAIRDITSKGTRKRTEQDEKRLRWLMWQANIYWSDSLGGPCLPAKNVEACIRDGARMNRQGKDIERALMVDPEGNGEIRLAVTPQHSTREQFYNDPAFVQIDAVKRKGSSIQICRPRFQDWAAEFVVAFDDAVLKIESVKVAIENAGLYQGVGGYKPRYGRFEARIR